MINNSEIHIVVYGNITIEISRFSCVTFDTIKLIRFKIIFLNTFSLGV